MESIGIYCTVCMKQSQENTHTLGRRGCNRDRKRKQCLSSRALGKRVQSDSALLFFCLSPQSTGWRVGPHQRLKALLAVVWLKQGGKLVLFFHPLQVMNPVWSPHQLKPHEQLHRRAHSVSQFDGWLCLPRSLPPSLSLFFFLTLVCLGLLFHACLVLCFF